MTLVLGAVRSSFTGRQGRGQFQIVIPSGDTKLRFHFAAPGNQEGIVYKTKRTWDIPPTIDAQLQVFQAGGRLWADGKPLEARFFGTSGSLSLFHVTIPDSPNPPAPDYLTFGQLAGDRNVPPIPTGDPDALGIHRGFEIFADKLYNVKVIAWISGKVTFSGWMAGERVWELVKSGRILHFNSNETIDLLELVLEITGAKTLNLNTSETFFGIIEGGFSPFKHEWKIDGNVVSDFTSIDAIFTEPGAHTISFKVTDAANQTKTVSLDITVLEPGPEPTPEPGPDEGLSLDTKIGIVLGVVAVGIGTVLGLKLASKPKK